MSYFSLFAIRVLLIFMCSSWWHSPREKEGKAISATDVANKTLLPSNVRDFFSLLNKVGMNKLVNIISYLFLW